MKQLLAELRKLNISLSSQQGELTLFDPDEKLTDELLTAIRQNKAELLTLLKGLDNDFVFELIPPAPVKSQYKLSSAQKRLHFQYELEKQSLAYNISQVMKVEGRLDKQRLQEAFNDLLQRHDSLRTGFEIRQGELVQVVAGIATLAITNLFAREDKVEEVIKQFIRPFVLDQPPLWRVALIETDKEEQLLVVDMHHIITDGVSHSIFLNDLINLYRGKALPALPLQYKDYAEWQQGKAQSREKALQKAFWHQQFLELPGVLDLPTDYPRPAVKKYEGDIVTFELGKAASARLRALAEAHGATMFMQTLSCFAILLNKLSGQEDIVIGTPVAGRHHADLEQIIGMFVNTLPLRVQIPGDVPYTDYLAAVRSRVLACFERQVYQYEDLIIDLQVERDRSRNPLFDVMFIYQNFDHADVQTPELHITYQKSAHKVAKFDLTLVVEDAWDQLVFHLEYNTSLFAQHTIERFARYFRKIVSAVVDEPGTTIAGIRLIDEAEEQLLLHIFNQTADDRPGQETILELFNRQVNRAPHAIALIERTYSITYLALQEKVNEFAFIFKQNGAQPGEVIALLYERSVDCVAAILAILKVGCTYLPISMGSPGERIDFLLEDSKARILFTNRELLAGKELRWGGLILFPGLFQTTGRPEGGPSKNGAAVNTSAYIIYTSGSTGAPKGVIGTQQSVINRLYWGWKTFPYGPREVCVQKTSLDFVDHVAEIFSPLLAGVPQVILGDQEILDPLEMIRSIQKHHISRITVVPSLLQLLIGSKKMNNLQLPSLRYVFSSGEELSFHLAQRFYREFGQTRLINIYGSTEIGADVTWHEVDRFNVEDVLQYFRNASGEIDPAGIYGAEGQEGFTTGHVKVEALADKFMESRLMDTPLSLAAYYSKLNKDVIPYTVNTASPAFIGHMTSVLPDYVHDLSKLISQLNQNLVKIETSKALTFLEREAIARLHRLFYDLPDAFYQQHIQKLNANLGIITSGGTIANISALLSARNKCLSKLGQGDNALRAGSIYSVLQEGGYKDMVLIGSPLMHYSFRKAQSLLGLGTRNIIYVRNDASGRMCVQDLEEKILECQQQQLLVLAIIGIAGSTETGCIDPLEEIGRMAAKYHIHFHVDAAWGGALIFSGMHKELIKGIEQADSITFCGHKQLYLPQGISVCLFKDPGQLNYNATTAAYQATAGSFDTGRFTIEGSRPALSLCLHASLEVIGQKGYELLIDNNMENAALFARIIQEVPGFELISSHINIINYRYIPQDCRIDLASGHWTAALNEKVNQVNTAIQEYQFYAGKTFVSKTIIRHPVYGSTVVFRAVISNPLTARDHLINVISDQLSIIKLLYGEDNAFSNKGIPEEAEEAGVAAYRKIPIGRPLANTQLYILDKNQQLQPVGVAGEICVSGVCLAKGYVGQPEVSQTSFVPNPFPGGALLYRTGDMGRWLPDGNVEFLGRKDSQLKIRGFRIEPGEIEYHLASYPGVKEATVVAKDHKGGKRLVAYFTANAQVYMPDLRSYMTSRLPAFLLPSFFVQLEVFPLTATGKLNKRILPDPGMDAMEDYRAPADEIETTLVEIWSELLGTDKASLSVNKNFFELGGHSLITPVLLAAIDTRLKVSITLPVFFQHPSIAPLAAYIRTQKEQLLMPGA